MNTPVGDWIRKKREQIGWSQTKLAEEAGISQGYLCQIERGEVKEPSAKTLLLIAGALLVDPAELWIAAGWRHSRNLHDPDEQTFPIEPGLLRYLAKLSPVAQRNILSLLQSLEKTAAAV